MKNLRLKMGDIESEAVCYEDGLVAHRPRKDGGMEFSDEELRHIVKCCNERQGIMEALRECSEIFPENDMSEMDAADFVDRADRIFVAAKKAAQTLMATEGDV